MNSATPTATGAQRAAAAETAGSARRGRGRSTGGAGSTATAALSEATGVMGVRSSTKACGSLAERRGEAAS